MALPLAAASAAREVERQRRAAAEAAFCGPPSDEADADVAQAAVEQDRLVRTRCA